MTDVSIIIVTYNSVDEIEECIASVYKQDVGKEVFIVDNQSQDATREVVNQLSKKYSGLFLIESETNVGLAAGNNIPLQQCQGEYILILNPDTILSPDCLLCLIQYIKNNENVGIVGPRGFLEDESVYVSSHRSWNIFHFFLIRHLPEKYFKFIYFNLINYPKQTSGQVLYVSGACLLIKSSLMREIEGYDERFFLSLEDVADLCIRGNQKGYEAHLVPEATFTHLKGRSRKNLNYLTAYYNFDASLYFLKKYEKLGQFFIYWLGSEFIYFMKYIYFSIRKFFNKTYSEKALVYLRLFNDFKSIKPYFKPENK
jgi:GT2 family glycosyltransferase